MAPIDRAGDVLQRKITFRADSNFCGQSFADVRVNAKEGKDTHYARKLQHTDCGHCTRLNRIGAALFLGAVVLLTVGTLGVLASWGSEGSISVRFMLSESQTLLLGFASLVCSAIVFGLAIINERLVLWHS